MTVLYPNQKLEAEEPFMAKPTPKQVEALRDFGITPPPTKAGCSSLLRFIIEYRWGNLTRQEKIALAISTQQKWLGKRVSAAYPGNTPVIGVVDYVLGLKEYEYFDARRRKYKELPFHFWVTPDDGTKNRTFRRRALTLIAEDEQATE